MTTEEMLVKLPCLWADEAVVPYGEEYCPNLYPYDEEWHLTWIHCSEGDTLVDFQGATPNEAVSKAYDYIKGKGISVSLHNFQ